MSARTMNHHAFQQQHDDFELALHDTTIQNLFGLGLRLEICQALIDEDAGDEARNALLAAIDNLDQVIERLRDRIYTLNRRSAAAMPGSYGQE